MDPQYTQFIDELINRRNLPDLTPQVREELRKDAMDRLDTFILDRIIGALTEEDANQFVALVKEQKTDDELRSFVMSKIENYETFLKDALQEFVQAYTEQYNS